MEKRNLDMPIIICTGLLGSIGMLLIRKGVYDYLFVLAHQKRSPVYLFLIGTLSVITSIAIGIIQKFDYGFMHYC